MTVSSWHNYMMRVLRSSKQKLSQGEEKYKYFRQDHMGVLWFESRIVVPKNQELRKKILDEALSYPKIMNSEQKFLMKHIFPNSLFIQAVAKCIRTSNKISGGPG
jgi:hypothetical protein